MLKNSPDTFSTHEVFFFITRLLWLKKRKEMQKQLFVGTTTTSLQNEFYRFPRTGLQYCIIIASHTVRWKHFPIFTPIVFYAHCFHLLLSLAFGVSLTFSLLEVSSMFTSNCICINFPLFQMLFWHTGHGLKNTSWDGTFLTTQSKTEQLPSYYLSKHKISFILIALINIWHFLVYFCVSHPTKIKLRDKKQTNKTSLFQGSVLASRTVLEYFWHSIIIWIVKEQKMEEKKR